jgi:micrococcal nuclease
MAQHYHDTVYRPRSAGSEHPYVSRGNASASGVAFVFIVLLSVVATFYAVWHLTGTASAGGDIPYAAQASLSDTESASFSFCHQGGGINCVVDGDTLYYRGQKIRIADIDTPETHDPRCPQEAKLGAAATQRLRTLVNSSPFSLQSIDRDEDRYGRKLRIISRGGQSLGGVLVNEGLARWYGNGRQSWC